MSHLTIKDCKSFIAGFIVCIVMIVFFVGQFIGWGNVVLFQDIMSSIDSDNNDNMFSLIVSDYSVRNYDCDSIYDDSGVMDKVFITMVSGVRLYNIDGVWVPNNIDNPFCV